MFYWPQHICMAVRNDKCDQATLSTLLHLETEKDREEKLLMF